MDIWLWLTGALLVSIGAVCGTMLVCEKLRCKALADYDFRGEQAYKQIKAERDGWMMAYESEHAEKEFANATIRIQRLVMSKAKIGGKTK